MDGLQYVEVYQAVKQKVLRQFWLTTSLTYSCTNELPYHVVSSAPQQHISLLIQTTTIAEFILEMENSSQTEKLPMKTRLNRNLETSAATLSYQFHLPRTYFSPTGIFRLRISTDINLRRVNKIKFLFGSILVPVFFRVSDLKPVFIYPSECEFRTGFRSRRDFRPTFPHLFRQENRSKIFRRDTRLSMLIYLAFTLVVNGWKLK